MAIGRFLMLKYQSKLSFTKSLEQKIEIQTGDYHEFWMVCL